MSPTPKQNLTEIKKLSYRTSIIDEAYTTEKDKCLMKTCLEIHFVHQSEDKSLAVIAVMVNEGEANPALAPVVEKKLTI